MRRSMKEKITSAVLSIATPQSRFFHCTAGKRTWLATYDNRWCYHTEPSSWYSEQRSCSNQSIRVGDHCRAATGKLHGDCARCKWHDRSWSTSWTD